MVFKTEFLTLLSDKFLEKTGRSLIINFSDSITFQVKKVRTALPLFHPIDAAYLGGLGWRHAADVGIPAGRYVHHQAVVQQVHRHIAAWSPEELKCECCIRWFIFHSYTHASTGQP